MAFVRVDILPGNSRPSLSGVGALGAGSAPRRRHQPRAAPRCLAEARAALLTLLPSLLELLFLAALHNSALSS